MQQNDPPPFDQYLVGKLMEVLWKYTNMETGEKVLIRATGRIVRVAVGLTDKRSPRAQKIPASQCGAVGSGRGTRTPQKPHRSENRQGAGGVAAHATAQEVE